MSRRSAGRWQKDPPAGDAAYVYDRKALREWAKQVSSPLCGAREEPQFTTPRIGIRSVVNGEAVWTVTGMAGVWPERVLRERCVWWSKPIELPRIEVPSIKELVVDE